MEACSVFFWYLEKQLTRWVQNRKLRKIGGVSAVMTANSMSQSRSRQPTQGIARMVGQLMRFTLENRDRVMY